MVESEYMTSTDARKLLNKVPMSKAFKLHLGTDIYDLNGLAEALDVMDDESFRHHVTKDRNDFARWVEDVLGDEDLAKSLEKTNSRLAMLHYVKRRIEFLETINTEQRVSTAFLRYTAIDFTIGLAMGIVAGYLLAKFVVP